MLAAVLWYYCFNQCILLVDVNHWRIAGNSWQLINSSVVVWCEKQLAWNVDGFRTLRPKRKTVTSISTDSESRPWSVPLKKSPCLPHKQHILSETAGTYELAFEKKDWIPFSNTDLFHLWFTFTTQNHSSLISKSLASPDMASCAETGPEMGFFRSWHGTNYGMYGAAGKTLQWLCWHTSKL